MNLTHQQIAQQFKNISQGLVAELVDETKCENRLQILILDKAQAAKSLQKRFQDNAFFKAGMASPSSVFSFFPIEKSTIVLKSINNKNRESHQP